VIVATEREIFMSNGSYLMCTVNGVAGEYMLCYHSSRGEFIAKPQLGTMGECPSYQLFDELKKQLNNTL